MKKEIEQLAKKLFNPYAEELKFDEKSWRAFLNRLSEFEQAVTEEIKQKINKIELTLSEEDKKKLEGKNAEFGMGYGQAWLLNKINKLLELEPDRDYEAEGLGEYEAQMRAEAEWEARKAAEAEAEWEEGQCIPDEEPPF